MSDQTSIPCPRFEIRWNPMKPDWSEREVVYSLVIDRDAGEHRVEINRHKCDIGGIPIDGNGVLTLAEDRNRALEDALSIGGWTIPIVAICGDIFSVIPVVQMDERT